MFLYCVSNLLHLITPRVCWCMELFSPRYRTSCFLPVSSCWPISTACRGSPAWQIDPLAYLPLLPVLCNQPTSSWWSHADYYYDFLKCLEMISRISCCITFWGIKVSTLSPTLCPSFEDRRDISFPQMFGYFFQSPWSIEDYWEWPRSDIFQHPIKANGLAQVAYREST